MPPKGKALAKPKAKAKGKAKAKAGAKAKARIRPGRVAPRRRPAGVRVVPSPVVGAAEEAEKFAKGERVSAHVVGPLEWQPGLFVALEGTYWQGPSEVAGRVVSYLQEGDNREIVVDVRGTTTERLLKWASGQAKAQLRVHLCPAGCSGEKVSDDYFHAEKVCRIPPGVMVPWMTCLEPGGGDELRELRMGLGDPKEKKDPKKDVKPKSSDSSSGRKKKEKKKKKKKKKEEKERSAGSTARARSSGRGSRLKGQMKLDRVFGGTGLDPKPEVRRQIRKKVRKSLDKRGKKETSSGSSTSTSSSGGSLSNEGLFPEGRKVRGVARKAPGALAAQAIEEMREHLLTSSGQVWSLSGEGAIPPLALQYYRMVMRARMSGGMAREALTMAYIADLGLQGRIAEAMDVTLQRLKSLELSSSGTDYRVSQRIELAPLDQEAVASATERRQALQEVREEAKLRHQSGKGGDWQKGDSWKGGQKGKWDRPDGKGKDKKGDRKGEDATKGDRGGGGKRDEKTKK